MGGGDKNILVVGSGGREHSLSEKLETDESVGKVFCASRNGGTASSDRIYNLDYKKRTIYTKIIDKNIDFLLERN